MNKKRGYVVTAVLLLSSAAAMATPITVDFTATINSVGASVSGAGINVGDAATGQFVYDTLVPDLSSDPDRGVYAVQSFTFAIGAGFSATAGSARLATQNDQQNGSATLPADGLTVLASSASGDALNGRSILTFQFGLRKENVAGHLWADDLIPDISDWAGIALADINAPDWHWMAFERMGDASIFDAQIRWDIVSFAVTGGGSGPATRVTEPGTLWLLFGGLVSLLWSRRA